MNVPVDEVQFLAILVKRMYAKKTMETGVFPSYSLLATALALPDDGKIIAIHPDKEAYETGLPYMREAGVEHKIDFINSDDIQEAKWAPLISFSWTIRRRKDYIKYHEILLPLVKVGGVTAYDNTLWFDLVSLSKGDDMPVKYRPERLAVRELNEFLAKDARIETCLLSIRDGLTLCSRLTVV
ncbi:hypothetical protein MLD38_002397 [Melastoma candidum]|uniref:Uncharacterized protein n=1 Tax=Melastoma candidum TaxID=119954 RepID=A0ACB9S0I1_9MYRT|nr:hypothetical protein MLD38_002397 [Melastoma candidum]